VEERGAASAILGKSKRRGVRLVRESMLTSWDCVGRVGSGK
jgi:hypothetical protein